MKQFIFTLTAIAILSLNIHAQEVSADAKSLNPPAESVFPADTINFSDDQDTSIVRIGKKEIEVIEDEDGMQIICGNNKHRKNKSGKFNGHWEGVEFGFNAFDQTDYSIYNGTEFMALNQGKSMEFDLNFYELNIGLIKSYVGLVSGMGLSFNSYRFENPYTFERGLEMIEPILLAYDDLSKTKLAVSYLNIPLLLEFQIPVNQNEGRLFINAGIVGGVKLGSHTKVKHGETKDKDHSGFYINSFNYAATARIGYKDIGLFAKYSLTPLFETGKGPELTPFTIGISFLD